MQKKQQNILKSEEVFTFLFELYMQSSPTMFLAKTESARPIAKVNLTD